MFFDKHNISRVFENVIFFQTTSKMQEHQMDTIENAITLSFGG